MKPATVPIVMPTTVPGEGPELSPAYDAGSAKYSCRAWSVCGGGEVPMLVAIARGNRFVGYVIGAITAVYEMIVNAEGCAVDVVAICRNRRRRELPAISVNKGKCGADRVDSTIHDSCCWPEMISDIGFECCCRQ